MAQVDIVTFKTAGETLGINIDFVREVIDVPKIFPVPETPDFVLGVINLRGEILAVVDVKKRLGLGNTKPDERSNRIIVVETKEHRAGLLVESLPKVMRLDSDSMKLESSSVQPKISQDFIKGFFEDEFLTVIDPNAILSIQQENG